MASPPAASRCRRCGGNGTAAPRTPLSRRLLERVLILGARLATALDQPDAAAARYRQAEPLVRATAALLAADRDVQLDLAECLAGRAEADRRLGRTEDVEPAFAAALAAIDADDALRRGDTAAGNLLSLAWIGHAEAAQARGDAATALARLERHREAMGQWAARFHHLSWPPRHHAKLEYGLGSAAEALGQDRSTPTANRRTHLARAVAAYQEGLRISQRLAGEGRLTAAEQAIPSLFEADLQRVAAALAELTP